MFNSGISRSATQTIAISITKLNRLKVKIRSGKERIFKTGAIARFSNAMAKPATAKTPQEPEYSTPGMMRSAKKSAVPLPIVNAMSFASIGFMLLQTLLLYSIKPSRFGNLNFGKTMNLLIYKNHKYLQEVKK